ncbi:cobyrinate a,c-diamide synthase [Desulfobacca acetoxidans]|uniref:Cobyrinate a,c-diamide synthase n=1 Tax=Desulfobacca acetoxidans (strain ATCC 700848 / DSM 11109 / ASRB2) TaxID=880072 RepID=F2NFF0_DESAR|nr:cobyrinate a,c-diamide synthase [Desulfobacca acetoxidans]AEB10069.1 Cobyrinic acid A,C-diamide synthase [Desulfobacca acetoxidans DSM 11109]
MPKKEPAWGRCPFIMRGLVVAGTHSGVGKTTLTLGLLAAWRRQGISVRPFKVGPDFIDPGHHAQAANSLSHNLDGWMLSREENLRVFRQHTGTATIAVVEGVMGLFDGYDGNTEAGCTAQMAKWLGLPVLLLVDARSMARSAAALVHGFATFDRDLILAGVVFNQVGSPTHLRYLRQALEQAGEVRCFGGLPREVELAIPERHLGLITTDDHPLKESYLERLADLIESNLDLEGLLAVLPALSQGKAWEEGPVYSSQPSEVRLAVARDRAFCFYYPDNLKWLARCGAEIVPFSPLDDTDLPAEVHGVYLGGGYPELFARQLSSNQAMLRIIRERAGSGMPMYAECGGLMYLSQEIQDLQGGRHAMAKVLPFGVRMLPRLKTLGYREVTLAADGLLGPAGTRARGHEYHYSEMISEPVDLPRLYRLTARTGGKSVEEGYTVNQVLASYVHLHFGSNPEVAWHFVGHCRRFKEKA